ncbi:TRADD-N-associated membrane domain-containing protein [Streptomyces minutiscleroticus]|uniref:TRADD-N-associated membrane domain-containing protein n=1 Tax=Streptomyces minutiscleroticus TaxID=68238 RepID=UPI00332B5E70
MSPVSYEAIEVHADAVVRRLQQSASTMTVGSDRSLALASLWKVTHRRLDYYHGIATNQAKRSFLSAQVAMGVGFLLLVAFVLVALNASTTAGAIVAGGLGAVSATLAGFVSRTFVRSQETAAEHLKAYFDQPLEFSRYLAAERLIADSHLSDEQRAEVVMALVQAIAAGPDREVPASAEAQQQTGQ